MDAEVAGLLERVLSLGTSQEALAALSDDELLTFLRDAEAVGRAADAARLLAAGEATHRSRASLGSDRLSARRGCRNAAELVARATKVSGATARWRASRSEALRSDTSLTGELLPCRFPLVRDALECGVIGLDAASAITRALSPALAHGADPGDVAVAEAELVATATGIPVEDVLGGQRDGGSEGPDGPQDGADAWSAKRWSAQVPGARGFGGEAADTVAMVGAAWALYLDPDGAVPADDVAMRRRGVTLGRMHRGTVSISGELLPEVAAALQRMFDAVLNPRVDAVLPADHAGPADHASPAEGSGPADDAGPAGAADPSEADGSGEVHRRGILHTGESHDLRSAAQKRHDAFASMVTTLSGVEDMPLLGGAPPTLVVTVDASQLEADAGVAFLEGAEGPDVLVSSRVARQVACTGAVQRVVTDASGRIVGLGTPQRVFTAHQRRAIAARDGACIIPGCGVRATWCEVHHVHEHVTGGPTHTDNGVLLCWIHHRTLDTSGWQVRMRDGLPWVKAPPWIDPDQQWRPARAAMPSLWRDHPRLHPPSRSSFARADTG